MHRCPNIGLKLNQHYLPIHFCTTIQVRWCSRCFGQAAEFRVFAIFAEANVWPTYSAPHLCDPNNQCNSYGIHRFDSIATFHRVAHGTLRIHLVREPNDRSECSVDPIAFYGIPHGNQMIRSEHADCPIVILNWRILFPEDLQHRDGRSVEETIHLDGTFTKALVSNLPN